MCNRPITLQLKEPNGWDYRNGWRSAPSVQVPCGKCWDCLRKRANDIMVRCYREAKKYENAFFLTFTYDEEHLPLATSLWKTNKDTGESERITSPELIEARSSDLDYLEFVHSRVKSLYGNDKVVIFEHDIVAFNDFDKDNHYFARITPTLNVADVRACIKRFRVKYKRKYDKDAEFSYCLVGEYGLHGTRRPHYHMLVFTRSLTFYDMLDLKREWTLGSPERQEVKHVMSVNKDGSNGLYLVCKYIGKYMSKGPIESDAVRQGLTLKSRLCASIGLGADLTQKIIEHHQAQDVYRYDVENPFFPDEKTKNLVLKTIYDRLHIDILTKNNDKPLKYGIPISIRKKIFGFHNPTPSRKGCWSAIWYMEAEFIRSKFSADADRKFRQFISNKGSKSLCQAVFEFYNDEKRVIEDAEASCKARLIKQFNKSKI